MEHKIEKKYWGTVYDSETKQPLDPVIIQLYDARNGALVAETVTDMKGQFGFLTQVGTFVISAKKTHYKFPSTKITGDHDGIYKNLYHGESFILNEAGQVFAPNIPMDPIAFDWNQQKKKHLFQFHPLREIVIGTFFKIILKMIFGLCILLGLILLTAYPTVDNLFLFSTCLLVVTIIIKLKSGRRLWGELYTRWSHKPIANTVIELSPLHERDAIVAKAVTGPDGKFFLKAPPGKYTLRVKVTPEKTKRVDVGKRGVVNENIAI